MRSSGGDTIVLDLNVDLDIHIERSLGSCISLMANSLTLA